MSPNSVTLIESCDRTVRLPTGRRKQCHAVCPSKRCRGCKFFWLNFSSTSDTLTQAAIHDHPPGVAPRALGVVPRQAEAEGKNKAKRTTIIGYYCWTIIFGYIIIPLFPGAVSHRGLEQQGRMQNENPINKKGSAKVDRFV